MVAILTFETFDSEVAASIPFSAQQRIWSKEQFYAQRFSFILKKDMCTVHFGALYEHCRKFFLLVGWRPVATAQVSY